MAGAALVIEFPFDVLGLIPGERNAKVVEASVTWNYKTLLNIVFLALAVVPVLRFLRTGGLPMLKAMNKPAEAHGHAQSRGLSDAGDGPDARRVRKLAFSVG